MTTEDKQREIKSDLGNRTINDVMKTLNEDSSRKYLANLRWGEWAKCPHCNNPKAYFIENGIRYKCANKKCYKKFSVTTGTLIEASNIPLQKWVKIVFWYIKKRGRCMSWDLEKEFDINRRDSFIIKEKLDFCFKYVEKSGKGDTEIFNETFKQIFNLYEYYDQFKQVKYTSKFHISDSDINDLSDIKQYNKLINYIRYYINVYCDWIWLDFATPSDILSETFLMLKDKGIKEYNGSTIIKHIQYTVNRLWYSFLKEHPKYYNKVSQWQKRHKESARLNLSNSYIVEKLFSLKDNKMTRTEIKSHPELIGKKREELLKRRKRLNKNYEFVSHFS